MFIFIICTDNIWTQTCLNEGPCRSLLINAYKSCPSKATLSDMVLRNTNTEAVTIDMNFMVLHTTHYPLHIQQSKVHEPIVDVMGQSQQYQTPYQVYKAHTLLSQAQVTSSPHPCIAGAAKINWLLLEYAIERWIHVLVRLMCNRIIRNNKLDDSSFLPPSIPEPGNARNSLSFSFPNLKVWGEVTKCKPQAKTAKAMHFHPGRHSIDRPALSNTPRSPPPMHILLSLLLCLSLVLEGRKLNRRITVIGVSLDNTKRWGR